MLFSEPKIPQLYITQLVSEQVVGFSALQRAENSSMYRIDLDPKNDLERFSALQRAENSSIEALIRPQLAQRRFSALQRAENSSIERPSR